MAADSADSLFGHRPDRTRLTLALAAAIFLATLLVGTYARGRWMQAVMESTALPVAFLILVGGGLAIWNAYWNDGLLLGWLLLGCLVGPWLLHYNLRLGISQPFVSAGYVTLALVVGTAGYLVGVGLRRIAPGETGGELPESVSAVFGPTPDGASRWLVLLGSLFAVPAVLVAVAGPYRSLLVSVAYPVALFYPVGTITGRAILGAGLVLGWIAVATWPASRGNGLLVSWGVLFAPMFGTLLSYSLLESFFTQDLTSSLADDVRIAALVAVAISVILGTLGFVTGVLIRRTVAARVRGRDRIGV